MKLKKYREFVEENKDYSSIIPDANSNINTIKIDPQFKKTNEIPNPEVDSEIEPIHILSFDEFMIGDDPVDFDKIDKEKKETK
jgi:hypothetical protein